jgi:hypothetical protein
MAGDFAGRVYARGAAVRSFIRLVQSELEVPCSVSLRRRLWAWRRGFAGRSVVRYGLTDEDFHLYLSDWARFMRTPSINGRFGPTLNNKIALSRILASYGCAVPEYYCLVRDGLMYQIGNRYRMHTPDDVLTAWRNGGRFVVKPFSGGGGLGVSVLRADGERLAVNGQEVSHQEASAFLGGLDDATICEYIQQHEYAHRVFPHSANSLRILTMWDFDKHEPFIVSAVHRFGTQSSIPVDNSTQGGLFCHVDLPTGELGELLTGRWVGPRQSYDRHPDTGEQVAGLRLPHWDVVKTRIVEICREMAYVPYIGWDVVITPTEFAVLECNSYPGIGYQLFQPLLADARVRAFYERFGVV